MWSNKYFVVCVAAAAFILVVNGAEFSGKEKQALAKLKETAGPVLKLKYFKDDYVLVHFLRDHEFDIPKTIEQLKKTASWRKTNNMDKIDDEPILENLLSPQYVGVDKAGHPLILIAPARWDNRKVILNGDRDKLILKWAQFIERAHRRIQKLRAQGKDVTQGHMILDLKEYNLRQHACLQCFQTYFQWVRDWEQNYPQIFYRFTYINTPRIFTPLLELLKPIYTKHTRDTLQVLGPVKEEYQKELFKTIDPSELLEAYGGTRKS